MSEATSTFEFNFDPTQVTTGFKLFDKGSYEFIIGTAKPFFKGADPVNNKGENYGVRYVLREVNTGDVYSQNCYMHNAGSLGFSKSFMMAAYGFKRTEEREFNEHVKGMNFKFNHETGEVGDYWTNVQGKRIVGDMDVEPRKDQPDTQQQRTNWRPIA